MICTIFFLSRILSIIIPYSTFDLGPCLESRPHVRMSAIKVDDKPISWERTDGGPNAVLARGCTAFSKRRSTVMISGKQPNVALIQNLKTISSCEVCSLQIQVRHVEILE